MRLTRRGLPTPGLYDNGIFNNNILIVFFLLSSKVPDYEHTSTGTYT